MATDKSIERLRLEQIVKKVQLMMSTQQDYFKCNKAQWPDKKARLLGESKQREDEMRGFIKQLKFEKLID